MCSGKHRHPHPPNEPYGQPGHVYQALFDNMASGFGLHEIVTDEAGTPVDYRILQVNRAFEEQTGLRASDILGKRATEVLPGIEATPLIGLFGEVALTGRPARFDLYLPPLKRHYSISAFSLEPGQFAVVYSDITETVRAREGLKRYKLLSQHARDIILFIRLADGRIVEANHAAVRAYGYTLEELLSLTIQDLRAPATQALTHAQMAQANSAGVLFETTHRRKDGSLFPVEVSSLGTDIGGERVLLSIIRDTTERKAVERQREEFVNLAAHEMKTPLTIFKGYLQLLTKAGGHDDREKQLFHVLEAQANRLSRLVQTLLDASQIQHSEWPLRLARVDLGELVREAVEAAQAAQLTEGQRRPLVLALRCGGRATVEVDPGQIGEVLSNLLDNAVRYSPEGAPVEVTVCAAGEEIIVSVRDRGPGVPRAQQARLFEAWYQAAPMVRPTTGMGLGLYISREIVERHGGRIWLESEVGKGSTFSFSLPLR